MYIRVTPGDVTSTHIQSLPVFAARSTKAEYAENHRQYNETTNDATADDQNV